MRDHLVRGAAVAVALVLLAAACSSSSHKSAKGKVTVPTDAQGRPLTSDVTPTEPGLPTTKPGSPTTTPGTGTPVTDTKGNVVTTPSGVVVTTPATGGPGTTTPGGTTPPTTPGTGPNRDPEGVTLWKLAADYRAHPGTNPFASYLGGTPVWSLRQSQSLARDGNYSMLPTFDPTFGANGVSAWHANSSGCDNAPLIGTNTIDAGSRVCGAGIPGQATFVYPDPNHMPVVAWTSPFDGTITITHGVADLDPACGDGIYYYVELGTTPLMNPPVHLVNADAAICRRSRRT